jgi:hypothetical protein
VRQQELVRVAGPVERTKTSDTLEQHEPHGVDVRTTVDRIAARLLWRHVARRADRDPPAGDHVLRVFHLGDTEI